MLFVNFFRHTFVFLSSLSTLPESNKRFVPCCVVVGADGPLFGDEHRRSGSSRERRAQPVLHQSATVWRDGAGSVARLRQRPSRSTQAVAPAHAEGTRTLHPHADIPRGRGMT